MNFHSQRAAFTLLHTSTVVKPSVLVSIRNPTLVKDRLMKERSKLYSMFSKTSVFLPEVKEKL